MSWSGMNSGEGAVRVDSDLTTVALIKIQPGSSKLWCDIFTADHRISDFDIAIRSNRDSSAFTKIADASSDYTTSISWPLDGCSADLASLASDTWATMAMDCRGLYSVRMQARTVAASDTDVKVYWGMN